VRLEVRPSDLQDVSVDTGITPEAIAVRDVVKAIADDHRLARPDENADRR
jgi:hypothetical protein